MVEKEIEFMVRLKGKQAKYLSDFVEQGYYATKSEVVRAGILELAQKHKVEEKPSKEEVILVNKAIDKEMKKILSGKKKTYTEKEFYKLNPDMKPISKNKS
jgi:Arc/MetJ-type ribon-helix-helix transcriptional regulator